MVFFNYSLILIPKLEEWLISWGAEKDHFANQIRTIFKKVAIVAVFADSIGVHAMVGGFPCRISLSKIMKEKTTSKVSLPSVMAFGTDIFTSLRNDYKHRAIFSPGDAVVTVAIVGSLIASKTLSGFLAC